MKDILKKYYLIDIDEYKEVEDGITFIIDGNNYYLYKTIYDKEYINYIFFNYKKSSLRLHDFVKNKDNEIVSENYILFKLNTLIDEISLKDLKEFYQPIKEENYIPMNQIWEEKLDYLEQQVSELSDNTLINNSFDYFVGISELIISELRNLSYSGPYYLSHKKFSNSTLSFYNPLNITFDLWLRDIASYIRINKDYYLLYNILDQNLSLYEYKYLFCRLVFPFEYFECLQDVLLDKASENNLVQYLNNINEYEEYIFKIQDIFGLKVFLWSKKSN